MTVTSLTDVEDPKEKEALLKTYAALKAKAGQDGHKDLFKDLADADTPKMGKVAKKVRALTSQSVKFYAKEGFRLTVTNLANTALVVALLSGSSSETKTSPDEGVDPEQRIAQLELQNSALERQIAGTQGFNSRKAAMLQEFDEKGSMTLFAPADYFAEQPDQTITRLSELSAAADQDRVGTQLMKDYSADWNDRQAVIAHEDLFDTPEEVAQMSLAIEIAVAHDIDPNTVMAFRFKQATDGSLEIYEDIGADKKNMTLIDRVDRIIDRVDRIVENEAPSGP